MGLIEGSVLVFMFSAKPRVDKTVSVQACVFILPRKPDRALLLVMPAKWAAPTLGVVPWRHTLETEASV